MIEYNIPGFKIIRAEHLVLDFNGTVAVDGTLIPGVRDASNKIAGILEIHVVTADTFGNAPARLEGISCKIGLLDAANQDIQKAKYISALGPDRVIAVGNGRNDALMLKQAGLGIAVIQAEGAAAVSVLNADMVCPSILDALEIILNPLRVVATLRS